MSGVRLKTVSLSGIWVIFSFPAYFPSRFPLAAHGSPLSVFLPMGPKGIDMFNYWDDKESMPWHTSVPQYKQI
jgi:hypothetical protein